jgi:hypothetical protein
MITPTDASGRRNWLLGLVVILLCAMSVAAGDFNISWWTVDGGGVMLSAGGGDTDTADLLDLLAAWGPC